ncbi:hypothetical protein LXL04_031258 [Taraxacum kok-saghyz]
MSMDRREADLPADNPDSNLHRSLNVTTSSSASSIPSDFLRDLQAACKRRPAGMMPQMKPIRLVARGETRKSSDPAVQSQMIDESPHIQHLSKKMQDYISQTRSMLSSSHVTHEDASITPPTVSGKTNDVGNPTSIDTERCQPSFGTSCTSNNTACSSIIEHDNGPLVDGPKKVQFALQKNTRFHEMECDGSNQLDVSAAQQNFQNMDVDPCLKTNDEIHSLNLKSSIGGQDQIDHFRNFLQRDFGHNMTQSSVAGSSCATTTLMNSQNAPMLNSTTNCSCPQQTNEHIHVQNQPMLKPLPSDHLSSLVPSAAVGPDLEKKHEIYKDHQRKEAGYSAMAKAPDITDIQSQAPISEDQLSNVKTEHSKSEKKEKTDVSKSTRKRNHDPDLFFKVNGKLYQRLGKIGSGGSSEVHKVISQDCTIYALKKIKLKGRDYATAYGFCQEIEYLNKLKGMDHIIQLIDYEVTDKALLREVLSGSVSNKNGKLKDDGHIYMVLEYGEIDLAHMLSHKWKELDNNSSSTIDENWLRFYWQQILMAVKTIHEERIVHSDLKPANFLLVRGSLKLIDFGIAKAIMNDTTNIQRDSQVGTLSYMSPEAFMCNETDKDGNIIKCGRPSDIWSLGCILYQMVYGRTPFSDHKTFWAKFKAVTDPHHKITYEPTVSNPCLVDLMKKCLAWDRTQRWTIPQLLQHPFLAPPILIPNPIEEKNRKSVIRLGVDNPKVMMICGRIEDLIKDPLSEEESTCLSRLLFEMSKLCV